MRAPASSGPSGPSRSPADTAAGGGAAPADPTREAAFSLLVAVAERHRSLDEALQALPGAIAPRDRAAGHRLAAAVLRREGTLDAVLEPWLRRAPPLRARLVLRLGAASLLVLGDAPHAAVSTAVAIARSIGLAPFTGLVNAVLRRVAAEGPRALDRLDGPRLDTPPWLWASWGARARAIATAHAAEAPLDLTLRAGAAPPPEAVALPGGGARLPAGTRVADLPGYGEGAFWVQDQAAALPARLVEAGPGMRVLDLCAAPGGKTAQLAATGAGVVAVDRDAARLGRLRENLARLRLDAAVVEADMLRFGTEAPFDAVLLDAPCSATGTIRRHPDIPRLRRPADVARLAAAQGAMLDHAIGLVRPGGVLVYAVCSLQPEEGAGVVARAIAAGRVAPAPPDEATASVFAASGVRDGGNGVFATDPSMGMDGFQMARLRVVQGL